MKEIRGIWFPDGDQHFYDQLRHYPLVDGKGTYQLKKYHSLLAFVKERHTAIDIGGHVGLWARVMARDFRLVLSFEPMKEHIECWRRNLEGVSNAVLFETALSDNSETLRMNMPYDNTGHTHVVPDGDVAVTARSLDSYSLDHVSVVKIDVEGYELPVVRGARETLRRNKPVVIIEQKKDNAERYGWRRYQALELLKSWGMKEKAEISGDHILTW